MFLAVNVCSHNTLKFVFSLFKSLSTKCYHPIFFKFLEPTTLNNCLTKKNFRIGFYELLSY